MTYTAKKWENGQVIMSDDLNNIEQGTYNNDTTTVHLVGSETVAGDKVFTGKITVTQQITGALATRDATFTDFNQVFQSMNIYAGNWRVQTTPVSNSPKDGLTQYVVQVINYGVNAGKVVVTTLGGQKTFITSVSGGTSNGWIIIPNDGNVVHNTGTENINGDKTFQSGKYGLRVTTSGIQKTSDNGTTWSDI